MSSTLTSYFSLRYHRFLGIEWTNQLMVLNAIILHCKAILSQWQPVLIRWILAWNIPQVQDRRTTCWPAVQRPTVLRLPLSFLEFHVISCIPLPSAGPDFSPGVFFIAKCPCTYNLLCAFMFIYVRMRYKETSGQWLSCLKGFLDVFSCVIIANSSFASRTDCFSFIAHICTFIRIYLWSNWNHRIWLE